MVGHMGKNSVKKLRALLGLLALAPMAAACAPITTATGLVADAGYTASEKRSADDVISDNAIKLKLNQALFEADIDLFKNVSTVVYKGRVLLLGSVEAPAAKARAAALASGVEGVRELINDIQVTDGNGVMGFVNDVLIEKTIQSVLFFDDQVRSANYRVRSVNGVVYLIGSAKDRGELERVLAKVRKTDGVARVVNYIRLAKPAS